MTTDGDVRILTAYRTPDRIAEGFCGMCERGRMIVFDLTAGAPGSELATLPVCDECAPRAARLMAWLGEALS